MDISEKKKGLAGELNRSLFKLKKLTEEYLLCFDAKDFYLLSFTEQQISDYKNSYRRFALDTAAPMTEASGSVAKLASLMIEADRASCVTLTEELSKIFELFGHFCRQLEAYRKSTESSFANGRFSLSELHSGASKIKLYITSLLELTKVIET